MWSLPRAAESKLVLLAQQAGNSTRAELLGQEIGILFRKTAGPEDGGLESQRPILCELEVRYFYTKRGDGKALVLEGLPRGCVKCVKFLPGGSGQDVSWELNKVIFSLMLITWEEGFQRSAIII